MDELGVQQNDTVTTDPPDSTLLLRIIAVMIGGNALSVGYNPSVDLWPTDPSKWGALTFRVVTDRGGGNRVHAPAYNASGIDVPEFVYRKFGPENTAPWGPNADGTELAGVSAGGGIGRLSWQPAFPKSDIVGGIGFGGLAASISAQAAQDTRQEALVAHLAAEATFGPATPATITVNENLDAVVTGEGDTMPWLEAGTVSGGGTSFTYAGRSHGGAPTKLYGVTGGGVKKAQVFIDPAGDNNRLRWTAETGGAAGNNISIEYRDPGLPNQVFLAEAVGNAVIIHLETDANGAIVTTASQINSGIDAVPAIRALVVASNKLIGSTGAGVVTAVAATFLIGGTDSVTLAAGASVQQVRVISGGDLVLRATSVDAPDGNTDRIWITQSGAIRMGRRAIADQMPEFLGVEGGPARFKSLPTPTVTATVIGTPGTATITYKVVGNTPGGGQSLPGSVTIANAPNTLDDTNYVKLAWTPEVGYQTFDVIRSATTGLPATTGVIAYRQPFYNKLTAVDHGQAPAGINEEQTVQVTYSDGGTFTLTNPTTGATSAPIPWNASAATFKAAWEAVSGIGAGNTTVTLTSDPNVSGVAGWKIIYGSGLAATDVAQPVPNETSLTQSEDFVEDWTTDHGTPPPGPNVTVRTRVHGGPIVNVLPTRNSTADVAIDGHITSPSLVGARSGSGRWYSPPNTAGPTLIGVNDAIRAEPMHFAQAVTLDRLACQVTAAGEAGSTIRLGIYADDGTGYPGALLVDGGTVTGDTIAEKEVTISQVVSGLVWLVAHVRNAPTTRPTVNVNIGDLYPHGNDTRAGALAASVNNGWGTTDASATLPATFPAAAPKTSASIRVAARTV